ncbi:hypothetical protein BJX99DRAFT_256342 [Aspergillus californicus]
MLSDTIWKTLAMLLSVQLSWNPRPVTDGYALPDTYGSSLCENAHLDIPILTGNNKDDSTTTAEPMTLQTHPTATLAGSEAGARQTIGTPVTEGAFHGSELYYVFNNVFYGDADNATFTTDDYDIAEMLQTTGLDLSRREPRTAEPLRTSFTG